MESPGGSTLLEETVSKGLLQRGKRNRVMRRVLGPKERGRRKKGKHANGRKEAKEANSHIFYRETQKRKVGKNSIWRQWCEVKKSVRKKKHFEEAQLRYQEKSESRTPGYMNEQ